MNKQEDESQDRTNFLVAIYYWTRLLSFLGIILSVRFLCIVAYIFLTVSGTENQIDYVKLFDKYGNGIYVIIITLLLIFIMKWSKKKTKS